MSVLLLAAAVVAATPAGPSAVLLITLDTLRADHVGSYGAGPGRTPHLDRLAAEGARFEQAAWPAPLTRPAHASLLTGLDPDAHGVRDNLLHSLPQTLETIAGRFRASGFRTAAFVGSFILGKGSGLEAGFDVFSNGMTGRAGERIGSGAERRAEAVAKEAIEFLSRVEPPFFIWVHFYDPHTPYEPPEPFRSRFADNPYAGEIAYVDSKLGELLEALRRRGLERSTLVVATADHGEGLGDHGEEEHGVFVYEETQRVPLLVKYPPLVASGAVVPEPVGLIDLAPTMLEAAGLRSDIGSASSLWGRLTGALPDPVSRDVYFESFYGSIHFGWVPLTGLRRGSLTLIQAPRPELYDLATDPGERADLFPIRKKDARALRQALAIRERRNALPADPGSLSEEALKKLASLGYTAAPARQTSGADPKDKIEELAGFGSRLRDAIDRFHAGAWKEALPLFRELAGRDILSFEVHLYLGRCHRLVSRRGRKQSGANRGRR